MTEYTARHASADDSSVPRPRTAAELSRHGPNLTEAAIRVQAETVAADLATEKDRWRRGFTRRRVIAGAGAVGVAALGTQLVTTKYSFADPATNNRTLVIVFMRGGMDGLSIVVPANDANLKKARPTLVVPDSALLPGDSRFGLHPQLAPLAPFWKAGQMAAVHAVASPDASRSHFQAQDCLERGTATTAVHTGWLDRTLTAMGPGTTFRAVAESEATPRSLVGAEHKLTLDGKGRYKVSTGIRFFDHMLELVTRHGGFDLELRANGDLDVDQHHTVEDVGIALGEAVSAALGNRRGINRAGYFVMPMDETLGVAAIDLSGRVHAVTDLRLKVTNVGDLQSELVGDFFDGFAQGARANVHVKVLYGRSSHHQIEAIFKAFARALRYACSRDRRLAKVLPSTKELL